MGPRRWFAKAVPQLLCACGMPLPLPELQIWNENNQRCCRAKPCIWPSVLGDATAERIVDGWVKTGDIGPLEQTAASTCSTAPTTW